jgi:hypothetical protein
MPECYRLTAVTPGHLMAMKWPCPMSYPCSAWPVSFSNSSE